MSFTGGVLLSVGLLHLLPSSQRQIASELSRQKRQAARRRGDEETGVSPRAESRFRVGPPPVSAGQERSADDDGREPQGGETSFPRESGEKKTRGDRDEGDKNAPDAGETTGKAFPYASVCCLLGVLLVMVLEALAEGEHSHEVHSHSHTHEQVRTHLHTEKAELEAEEEDAASRTGTYEPPALTAETPETKRGKPASLCEGADGEAAVSCHLHGQESNRERKTESQRETNSSVCRGEKPGEKHGEKHGEKLGEKPGEKPGEGHPDRTSVSSCCASSCSASSHESLSSSASLCSCFMPAEGDRDTVESFLHPPAAGLPECVVPPPASAPPAFPLSHPCLSQSPPESEAASLCRGPPATSRALGNFFRRSNSCRESRRAATQTTRQRWLNKPSRLRRMYTAGCAVTAAAELSCAASSPCWCEAEKDEEERLAFPCRRELAAESEEVFLPSTQYEDDGAGFAATEDACSCGDKPKKRRGGDGERDAGEARWCCDGDFGPEDGSPSEETGGTRFRQASCCSQACAFAGASCCSQLWRLDGSRSTSLSQRRVCRSAGESFDLEEGRSGSRRDGDVGEGERRRDCGEDAPHSASCSASAEDAKNSRDSRGSGDSCAFHGHWTQHSRQSGGPAVEYSRSADHLVMTRESGTSRFGCLDTHVHATWRDACCRKKLANAKERSREDSPRGAAFLAAASSPSLFGSDDGTVWRASEKRRHRFLKSACERAASPLSLATPLLADATPPALLSSSRLPHCECGLLSPRSDARTYAARGFGESAQRHTHRWKAANNAKRSDGCRPLRLSACAKDADTLCRQGTERVGAAGLTNVGDSDRTNRRGGRMRSRCIYTVRNRCRKLCNRRHRVASSCGRCSSGNEGTRLLPPYGSSNTSATLADELRHEGDKTGAKELLVSGVLMLALSFHSLMEGVTLSTAPRPQLVAFAVLVHKGLESFALGSSLMQAQTHSKTFVWQMLLFALMTPAGVLLGIATTWLTHAGRESAAGTESSVSPSHSLLPGSLASFLPLLPGLLTGVGSGTFLHVSLLECIAPQLMRCRAEGKASLLSVIAAVCLGATLMVFLA
ncbi:metal cation transporter, ZIP family protein [Toxoplasma gondii GT1]|uniref:Metal cation transporter, ZIP family protein n=2 Tax=Toxoplasma gondii TaxID=5811 RepID=S7UYX2_TOXGG|nr:metal cation transporter, ZIP family protein [Toxoplasma gondii GT1]KAF4641194.1 metal cation transporter, ZIP family protein [Toxoplasma gondii]